MISNYFLAENKQILLEIFEKYKKRNYGKVFRKI